MGTVRQGYPVPQGAHEDCGVGQACTNSQGQKPLHGNLELRRGRGTPINDALARQHRQGRGPHDG
eukprot:15029255-Heterocapsa_arctica.AAC.1